MSKNRVYENGNSFPVTVPAGTVSGNPVVVGQLRGVARNDRQSDGRATVDFKGVYRLSVEGWSGAAAAAIAVGAIIYYDAGRTPKLNVNEAGVRFGYALDPVASGATTTIRVKVGY